MYGLSNQMQYHELVQKLDVFIFLKSL